MESLGIKAPLEFLQWQSLYEVERPFQIFINIPPDAEDRRTDNLVFRQVTVHLEDVRSSLTRFDIDECGFKYVRHESQFRDFSDRELVTSKYLPECEGLLREHLANVDEIFFFDWRLRKVASEVEEASIIDLNDLTNWLRPAPSAHIDQSAAAVVHRIKLQFPQTADFLLKCRVRVVNIWRPLIIAVEDWPLAVCDSRTVRNEDLVETDHVRRHYTGSTLYLMHNPEQKWYYMSSQGRSDVLIFKNFDSDSHTRARGTPHCSFQNPNGTGEIDSRKSIEVRALIFTYPPNLPRPTASQTVGTPRRDIYAD